MNHFEESKLASEYQSLSLAFSVGGQPNSSFLLESLANFEKKRVQDAGNPFCLEIAIPNCVVDGRSASKMRHFLSLSLSLLFLCAQSGTRTSELEDVENRIARISDARDQAHFHNFHGRETITLRKQLVNGTRTKFTPRSSYGLIEPEHFKVRSADVDGYRPILPRNYSSNSRAPETLPANLFRWRNSIFPKRIRGSTSYLPEKARSRFSPSTIVLMVS